MKQKLIFATALMLLTFAASDATTSHKSKIEMVYQGQPNGDYRLYLFGSDRSLICEEKPLKIVQQGDAVNPVIIECKHTEVPAGAHKAHVAGCWFHHGSGAPDTRLPDSDCSVKN